MSVDAWLLNLDGEQQAAVGRLELLHLLEYPDCYPLPGSPAHCAVALLWENQVLPVMDLAARLARRPMDRLPTLVTVVQYRPEQGSEVARGALVLASPPTLIQVNNQQACEPPVDPGGWREIASACFSRGEQPVPVLDLARLFSGQS